MAEEIRDCGKAFEPQSFNDKFNWPFIFLFALKGDSSFSFPWQPISPLPIYREFFELVRVMFRLQTLVWCCRFCFSASWPVAAPSHSLSICMATLYQASCCCPFLSSCWILIITFKGKRLQSSFIKCSFWEEASRRPTPTQASSSLHFCSADRERFLLVTCFFKFGEK